MGSTTMRTLRTKPVETLFFALLAVGSLVPSACIVGLVLSVPIFAVFVDRVLSAAERAADDAPTRGGPQKLFAAGTAAIVCVAVTLAVAAAAAGTTGIALTEAFSRLPTWGPVAVGLAAVVAAMLVAAAFAPLAFVPFAAADRRLGLFPAIVRGLEIAARDRRGALSRTAALAALTLVGPPMVLAMVDVQLDGDDELGMAVVALLVPCLAVSTAMIATRYVAVRRNAPPPDAARRLAPTVRASLALMPIAAALVLGTTAWAIATPAAPRVIALPEHALLLALSSSEDLVVPHSYLRVRESGDGFVLSTPDGGGAGRIRCQPGYTADPARLYVRDDDESLELGLGLVGEMDQFVGVPPSRACVVRVSRQGVRLDDDLLDRLERGSWLFPLGVWLALFGFLWLIWDAVRHAIDARVLAAADLSRDDAGGGLRAIEGTVVGSGASRYLEVAGGELRFALPRGRAFADGAAITVMARFTGSLGVGTREAPRALPRGARVVLGGADAARAFLVEQGSRSAIVATLIVIAGSVFAAVSLMVPLLKGG